MYQTIVKGWKYICWVCHSWAPLFIAFQLRWKGGRSQWLAKASVLFSCPLGHQGEDRSGISGVWSVHSILLRLWVGESVMTSLQGVGPRFRLAVESTWRAISSAMKVLRSTSWRPFLRRPRDWAGWVGEPGGPERTEILAMAPLRPERQKHSMKPCHSVWTQISHLYWIAFNYVGHFNIPCRAMASLKGCRSVSTELSVSGGDGRLATLGGARDVRGGGTLPHRKLMRSSRLIVLLRFLTQAITSLFLRW